MSVSVEGLPADAIAALLEHAVQQRPATLAALAAAREELERVREAMSAVILDRSARPGGRDGMTEPRSDRRPYVAWHVGRRGEVAGGMTQVVNGYLAWDFERFDVQVIVSRDGSKGPRAVRLFVSAAARILTLPRRSTSVVVVHLSQGGSFVREGLLLLLAHATGCATVAHLHGSSFAAFARRRRRLTGSVLRAADLVLALSEESAAAAAAFVGSARVRRVPNVVAGDTPEPKEHRVVFGGSVSKRKGVDVLLAAWRGLDHGDWTLDVVGPVADPEVVDETVPGAVFHGARPHAELMGLLRRGSVAVLPSREEALPMFLLEALGPGRVRDRLRRRAGSPPCSRAKPGIVVPAGEVEPLRRALESVMTSEARRQQLVDRGRRALRRAVLGGERLPRHRVAVARCAAAPPTGRLSTRTGSGIRPSRRMEAMMPAAANTNGNDGVDTNTGATADSTISAIIQPTPATRSQRTSTSSFAEVRRSSAIEHQDQAERERRAADPSGLAVDRRPLGVVQEPARRARPEAVDVLEAPRHVLRAVARRGRGARPPAEACAEREVLVRQLRAPGGQPAAGGGLHDVGGHVAADEADEQRRERCDHERQKAHDDDHAAHPGEADGEQHRDEDQADERLGLEAQHRQAGADREQQEHAEAGAHHEEVGEASDGEDHREPAQRGGVLERAVQRVDARDGRERSVMHRQLRPLALGSARFTSASRAMTTIATAPLRRMTRRSRRLHWSWASAKAKRTPLMEM